VSIFAVCVKDYRVDDALQIAAGTRAEVVGVTIDPHPAIQVKILDSKSGTTLVAGAKYGVPPTDLSKYWRTSIT